MNDETEQSIKELACELQRRGLATPALMLVEMATPLAFLGEQALFALGPLLPVPGWRETATGLIAALRDDNSRALLHGLLQE